MKILVSLDKNKNRSKIGFLCLKIKNMIVVQERNILQNLTDRFTKPPTPQELTTLAEQTAGRLNAKPDAHIHLNNIHLAQNNQGVELVIPNHTFNHRQQVHFARDGVTVTDCGTHKTRAVTGGRELKRIKTFLEEINSQF